jgi:4-hydroxybenzoate polyprenyltransferase
MSSYIRLLRINQWYKNLILVLPLVFSYNLFNASYLWSCFLGFVSLSLVSSSYYIINDICDREYDRFNPEKKKRPVASGEVSVGSAAAASTLLFVASLALAFHLSSRFAAFPVILMALNILYSISLKHIPLVDINVISFNFVLRAMSGAVLIGVAASSWMIITIYILALFLAVGKRQGELSVLGKSAAEHKEVYEFYDRQFLGILTIIITTSLFMSYILYTFMSEHSVYMLLTIPFAGFMIFRYMHFIFSRSKVARKTEYFFRDGQMLTALLGWAILVLLSLYGTSYLDRLFAFL